MITVGSYIVRTGTPGPVGPVTRHDYTNPNCAWNWMPPPGHAVCTCKP